MHAQLLGRTRHNAFRGFLSKSCGPFGENYSWPTTRPALRATQFHRKITYEYEVNPTAQDGQTNCMSHQHGRARAWGKAIHQEMNCGQRRPIVAIVRVRAMVGSRPPNANSDNDPSLLSLIVSVSPCPSPLFLSSPLLRPPRAQDRHQHRRGHTSIMSYYVI